MDLFGLNGSELIVLVAVAAVVLGPERLPEYARQLARLVRELRRLAQGAQAQVREELGPEFDDIDWRKLDPRQYDPRRIVRDALADTVVDPDDPLGMKQLDLAGDLRRLNSGSPGSPGSPAAQQTGDTAPDEVRMVSADGVTFAPVDPVPKARSSYPKRSAAAPGYGMRTTAPEFDPDAT